MTHDNPAYVKPIPLTDDQRLERDIWETILTVLQFGEVDFDRARPAATTATGLLMQLLRERGIVAEKARDD